MSRPLLEEARAALQRGELVHARKILRSLLLEDAHDEQAWLLMARVVDTPAQVADCLERALIINPHNLATERALESLKQVQPTAVIPPAPPSQAVSSELAPRVSADAAVHDAIQPAAAAPPRSAPPEHAAPPMPPARPTARARPAARSKTGKQAQQSDRIRPPRRMINWPLYIGAIIVALVAFLSVLGPTLATGDPLAENVIIKAGEKWVKPPFKPFEVPGFPLGSDQFGRDLFSRILYAIQPTMIMVMIVSLVRLLLGTVIGLGAGWSTRRAGRILDTLISAALSVPVFMIALGAIAMLGAVGGNLLVLATTLKAPESVMAFLKATSNSTIDQILPFVLGLSINGWGETARIVREQTRVVRGQLYVEAAHAMGASSWRILNQHVLRQIMSMVWMLFAFEISSTLMVTAGLGFLGYYIGGDVWIEVADFVSRRVSGTPELGQMLATSWASLTEPWPMVLTGTVIFLTVLGFNLLGDGLRSRLNPENINRNSLLARLRRSLSFWIEEHITYPAGMWVHRHAWAAALLGVLLVTAMIGGIWLRMNSFASSESSDEAIVLPGGHQWSGERGDPYGTRSSPQDGPGSPTILWQRHEAEGWGDGLAISQDGRIYLTTLGKKLVALDRDGNLLWESNLAEVPISSPALGLNGEIYVTDIAGGLTAFDAQGSQLWRYTPAESGKPVHGPISAADGSIYYLLENVQRGDTLLALDAAGLLRWSTATGSKAAGTALRLSIDGDEIYVKNLALRTSNGELLARSLPTADDPVLGGREQYFIGADQQRYVRTGHTVMRWKPQSGDFLMLQNTEWNYQNAGYSQTSSFPTDAGASRDQKIWLYYSVQYGGTTLIWLEPAGELIGISSLPLERNSILAGVDPQGTAYICGVNSDTRLEDHSRCLAYRRGSAEADWNLRLPASRALVNAAALSGGRLYVVSDNGYFFVIGDSGKQAAGEALPTVEGQAGSPPAELAWSTRLPGPVGSSLEQQEDSSLLALTVDNRLVQIGADGAILRQFTLQPGPYHHPEERFTIQPVRLDDEHTLVISSEKSAYLLDASGSRLWEEGLEANPAGLLEQRGATAYLSDLAGNLYAFGTQGLVWKLKPDGATKAVNRPAIGPDGRLYYVVIIDRRAYVQAVSPDGAPLWQALVRTGFFSYDLRINAAGTLLFLREDIFDTQAGMRLELTPPFRVDEYIMGQDGLMYMRSDHVVSQWELSEGGMKIVKTAQWNYQRMGRAPFMTFVTVQKVIWLYYGDTLVWLDLEGKVLGTIPLETSSVQGWDIENTIFTTCRQSPGSDQLSCSRYSAEANGLAWEGTVTGLADTRWGWVTPGGLTAVSGEDVIYQLRVDWPQP